MRPGIDQGRGMRRVIGLICFAVATVASPLAAQNDANPGEARIRELTGLSFGQIAAPSHGSNRFVLHWQNNGVTTAGSGDGMYFGGASSGRYRIRAQPYQTVTLTADIVDFSAQGVVVEEIRLEGADNTYSTALNGQGVFVARVGGVVRVDVEATPGIHHADVLMTVDYE